MAKNFEDAYAQIIARAWKDPQFKAKLLKNPRAALEEMGLKIDSNIQVKVVEDKPNSCTLVLPFPAAATEELSEKELSRIAGGAARNTYPVCIKTYNRTDCS